MAYTTGVFLFSDTRSGLEYTLLPSLDSWLVNEYYGLWHILEFAGVTGAIFFMVSTITIIEAITLARIFYCLSCRPCS